jgi:hypothetical protein
MSKLNTELKKLKELLKTAFDKLPDGTEAEMKIDNFAIGEKAEVVNTDGTLAPAPDGEYTNADGVKYTVKDGLIDSIDGQFAEEEKPVEQTATPENDFKTQLEAQAQEIADLKAKLETLETKMASDKEEETTLSENFSNQLKELNDSIKILATIPAEFSKTSTNNTVKDNKEDKLKELQRILSGK